MNHTAEVFQPLQDDDPRAVGGYRLAARLGAGGMGRVYLSHTQGGRPVAIKVVRSELADDPTFRRRFGREIKSARKVKGAYTAELIDADADGTPPWLATLYVPGPALSDVVARGGPLPVEAVLWLMAGVAEALQAIHGAGIVHRDLKPSNVLLASDGPRVIDFGISVAADSTAHTATGTAIGTPQYMAPEQASGGDVTAATDVFSLGQTAAFAALGEPLYGDGPAVSVLYRIVHSEPDLSGLPERLRPLIARCMAADPGERATAAEVVEWCRRELGRDVGAGSGPDVWRAVAGPEVTVPPPAPAPDRTAAHTRPWTAPQPVAVPQEPATAQGRGAARSPGAAQWPAGPYGTTAPQRPAGPEEQRRRRRRVALIAAAALAAGGLVIAAAWTVLDAAWDGVRDRARDAAASGAPWTGVEADESSAPGDGESGSAAAKGPGPSTARGTDPSATSGSVADGSAAGTATPRARAYGPRSVDADTSLSLSDGKTREDRKGDIRFDCEDVGCALESDTSVFTLMFGEPGATYEHCDLMTAGQRSHRVQLAAASAGMEICVRHRDGDIALLVVQTKSTAVPELAFLNADLTVWHAKKD
ncbi:serine/threonine-protein kinase [Streptomyces mutabilis]|uniref:Serine/threonine protein kinase n=1 Tax=Streptomyces mutabilis TaxID=67332 RepID=A0A086N070_9ACTN|nr:serine/threonine-protein kinase [Streptomyces mutabilis]KFG74538.1 serine/threonine protein kinase [Streptomyces mutabilis]